MLEFAFTDGQVHNRYKGKGAKRNYADQLLSLSEKCFLAILAPAFAFALNEKPFSLIAFIVMAAVFFFAALYFRHEGLLIYDEVNTEETR